MNKIYIYIDKQTNSVVTFTTTNEDKLTQLISKGIIEPLSKPLAFDPDVSICKEDPRGDFFDCWDIDNYDNPTQVVINMEKARAKWYEQLISQRDNRLRRLDNLQLRALGKNDQQEITRLEDIKQALRDLPQMLNLNKAENLQQLTNIIPAVLLAE